MFRELLPNKSKCIFRVHIKHCWYFQGATPKKIPNTFPQLTSNTTDILRELLVKNTTHCSIVYIKQCWHFQRVPSKLNFSKTFFQSLYHKILTLSKSYYHTILTYSELEYQTVFTRWRSYYQAIVNTFLRVSMNTWRDRIYSKRKFPRKSEKISIHTWNR